MHIMKQSTLFSILAFLRRNYILTLFMAFFAAWSSCSKDLSPIPIETRSIVANYSENPLFDTSSLLLSRIYQDLHTKNTADTFLNSLYENYGSFVWQASFIQKTPDSLPLMIVPLVRNNDVTALLFVQPMSNNRYIYNLVDRDYIVNNNALTSGTGLSKKLAYARLYLLNTFKKLVLHSG